MAVATKKKVVESVKPKVKKVTDQMAKKADNPTLRAIANKVAKMSLQDRLQIFVKAGLIERRKARAASLLAPSPRQSAAKKTAAKNGTGKSSR